MEKTLLIENIEYVENIQEQLDQIKIRFKNIEVLYNLKSEDLKSNRDRFYRNIEEEKRILLERFSNGIKLIKKQYDNEVEELNREEETLRSIINKEEDNTRNIYNNSIALCDEEYKSEVNAIEAGYKNGVFIRAIINDQRDSWKNIFVTVSIVKWIPLVIGIILLSLIQDFEFEMRANNLGTTILIYSLAVAGIFVILHLIGEHFKDKITAIEKYVNKEKYTSQDRSSLCSISEILNQKIKDQSDQILKHNSEKIKLVQESYRARKDILISDFSKRRIEQEENGLNKILELENKRQAVHNKYLILENNTTSANNKVLNELRNSELIKTQEFIAKQKIESTNFLKSINESLDLIYAELHSIKKRLNELPSTFETNIYWQDSEILKSQNLTTSKLRLGEEYFEIKTDIIHAITIPTCISFLNKSNIVFNCQNPEEIKKAISISHNIVARTLLSLPAGKLKLTFIDPHELGGNAAPFTPLLREIYGGMIFTEQVDIENQLLVITRAIENVIQRYLQDKFKDIAEYNFRTKEVPEAYRLIVVYNFPHGFNDATVKKLLNIIKSGPKTGIHTILINDRNCKLPYDSDWKVMDGMNLNEIILDESVIENNKFKFDDELPYSDIVDYINKEQPNANTIKVFFKIPPQSEWWKAKAHKHFIVPIGKHALEDQNFIFNNNDDNQALLIGKAGVGKSNLLHTIISNALWKYSPEQIEIYLIDFKGGVEFTIYANKNLPQIKALAIESEREFGESILNKLKEKIIERERLCTQAGDEIDNIEKYNEKCIRENNTDKIMPRIILVVDEFHLFFAEEDALARNVNDIIGLIVQKGRAFGINTLLSSQTLSFKSLNKAIKDLIDIRIALMCSDMDATQIFDDRNFDAKDLSRPGEAIYNDHGGKKEGNKRFQAFLVNKEELSRTINSVAEFARSKGIIKSEQIIFRGSEKAYIESETHPLNSIQGTTRPKTLRLWIGKPVTIRDDVTAVIRRQGGSNILIAGYDEFLGIRILASSIVSIAVQHQQNTCRFYCFNSYNVDSDLVGIPNELFSHIYQDYKFFDTKEISETLKEIKEIVEHRNMDNTNEYQNLYIVFFSVQRCRVFRKDGYSMNETANCLAYILKEGPDVGVYTLLQFDTMDNFSKSFDYNLVKEFSQRIVSQMNPDSSNKLIDNQKAASLGENRAIYFDDNENTMIKFKPYELPVFDWVTQIQKRQSIIS